MMTTDQRAAMTELINISIGVAANSLSEIVNTRVILKVPRLRIFGLSELPQLGDEVKDSSSFATVRQDFFGNLSGTAALAFPPESAVNLISLITETELSEENLDVMQTGTLLEIGNIINNAFLGTLNNQFDFHVNYTLPEYSEGSITSLVETTLEGKVDGLIMLADTNISVLSKAIEGHLLLIFEVADVDYLKIRLDEMMA